jgi:hypothetical protein
MKTTIDMAQEAQISDTTIEFYQQELKAFEALVRADEREIVMNEPINKEHWQRFEDEIRADEREACLSVIKPNATPMEIAAAIRARGNT